jgi:predicted DNA-binding transcriptional regulator YafY
MNRIDRLNAILIQMQSKKIVTASEIADRFEISLRTVYRDIRALESGGVPVGAEAGKGYFLMSGYHLPPVMFTKEEAASLLTGSKLIDKMSDEETGKYFDSAMYKIKSVLNSSEKEYLENLNLAVEVIKPPVSKSKKQGNISLTEIQNAIIGCKILKMKYFTNYRMKETEREIEPIGLCFYGSHWHLIGYCYLRQDYRDFRVDRIMEIIKTDKIFIRSDRQSLKEYINQLSRQSDFNNIIVRFKKESAQFISEQKYYWGFVDEEQIGDQVEMSFINSYSDAFARWLLMFGKSVEIIEPAELKVNVIKLIEELNEYYLPEREPSVL